MAGQVTSITAEASKPRDGSAALEARAKKVIPAGVNSPVRAFKAVGGGPVFMKRGITVQALYWLQGQYDAVTIIESDDPDAVNGLLLSIGAQGALRTETMGAMSLADIQRLTSSL